ncbi:MAG: DUF4215 domain-containing protein [Candidatus Komeilibacteria bacterium]
MSTIHLNLKTVKIAVTVITIFGLFQPFTLAGFLSPIRAQEAPPSEIVVTESQDNQVSTVTIVAHKIVCQQEASLPNWGNGRQAGITIDADTAANWVAAHQDCALVSGWNFQWSYDEEINPGDQVGDAGSPWQTFGPTNSSGQTTTQVPLVTNPDEIKVREVFQSGYLPFTGKNITENVSAEFYCNNDVLHYDNYDFVKVAVPGNTYHCVAWNVPQPPVAQCGNSQIEGSETCDEGSLNGQPLHCNSTCSGNTPAVCGNQITETSPYGSEQCDDGNVANGDGCSSSCQIEIPPSSPVCGNGVKESDETCDEGNLNGQPLHCNSNCGGNTPPVCGNQITETSPYGSEQCDDGNVANSDGCNFSCQIEPQACHSPLDYVNTAGILGPDQALTASDAVIFTARYEAALGSHSGDAKFNSTVDVKTDGVINAADYLCARPYYAAAGPYTCQLDCNNLCVNPLDYNKDYFITASDGVDFTAYYMNKTVATSTGGYLADLNGNGGVDYGDYVCANSELSTSTYQCPLQCAAVCGDTKIDKRLGETCDDGNITDHDGCSSLCRLETNQCEAPNKLDYNGDYQLSMNDAVIFTSYYQADNLLANVNNNAVVDYGDKLCADKYYGGSLAYTCTIACSEYTPVCGDTHKDAGEQCDDGNIKNGDGCSSSCQIEIPPSSPVCGNGQLETGEHCDDGNQQNGDGCNTNCEVEPAPVPQPVSHGGGGGGGRGMVSVVRLVIDKKVTPTAVEPGGQATYTVTLTNSGNTIATYVSLTDSMPSGITFVDGGVSSKTWNWDTLGAGQSVAISYTVKADVKAVTGVYLNQAQASAANAQSVSTTAPLELRQPTVAGVETVKPVEEKVKVLGYEKLPDTSGDWSTLLLILGIMSAASTGLLALRLNRNR